MILRRKENTFCLLQWLPMRKQILKHFQIKNTFASKHCQQESPPVGNRKRHIACGITCPSVTCPRGVPQSWLGESHPILATGVVPHPDTAVGRTSSWPGWERGYHILTWLTGTGVPLGTRVTSCLGLGYPLDGTWDQLLGYHLERTWDQFKYYGIEVRYPQYGRTDIRHADGKNDRSFGCLIICTDTNLQCYFVY